METSIKTSAVDTLRCGSALVPVLAGGKLTAGGSAIDAALGGTLASAIAGGDLAVKAGSTLMVYGQPRGVARVVLVSMGDKPGVAEKTFTDAVRSALRAAGALASADAASLLHEVEVADRDLDWKLHTQVIVARELAYRFDRLKSKPETTPVKPDKLHLLVPRAGSAAAERTVARAVAIANGSDLAKDLGNLPGNICTPTYLADTARGIARQFKLKVQVLEKKQMEALKMGSLLSVAQGSEQPPKLIVLHYQGAAARQAPVALVGKGITFDTGGISLKPGAEMDEMKYDMCGAASVLGTMRAIAEMKLPVNVVGVIPTCENMPSGRATRPGDIVTSMSGQTIEILNTDAEGRLILCDALTYVERFKPAAVIDVATLTGACVIALGEHNSGLFSNNDALADALLAAGRRTGDRCWRMPLDDEYQEQLKSPFADMANIGGRKAGSVTAACFLSRFAKAYQWAHLDIAGTAWRSGANKGASGRPVPLLAGYLIDRSGA